MTTDHSQLSGGLSSAEASARQQRFGLNALPAAKTESWLVKLLRQFQNPLIYILLFALAFGVVAWVMEGGHGVPLEPLTILLILLANAGLGMWQETKADAALSHLMALAAPKSWVLRDQQLVNIPSSQLVPGDLVRIKAGERVPADGLIKNNDSLLVDESMLTGESLPVDKLEGGELFAGTLTVRGHAYFEITRIGAQSSMGKLATLLGDINDQGTPLEKRMALFGNKIAWVVLILALALLVVGLLTQGLSQFVPIFIFAVALAVAAVPESLPAVLTLALALGVERMAKRKAVVRRLSAVEALGSVTVIATDKTGTLTENKMLVKKIHSEHSDELIKAMVLANDAEINSQAGDPLELGLLQYARDQGLSLEEIQKNHPRSSSRPFDSRWKYMRVTVTDASGPHSYFKGAPEILLQRCALSTEEKSDIESRIEAFAREGYRALAFASLDGEEEDNSTLNWLGLALFWDPPRAEIPAAIAEARQAGIRVLMITGDHPETAKTIAHAVGIDGDRVITGKEIDAMDDQSFSRAVTEFNIYARVSPEHKLRIVQALQAAGDIVAMTGDGVNDAPALKAADVGIAMGIRGSDVSREVADLILLDDNFATIVAAIEEGRSIYENIQKFIRTLFSANLSEVVLITFGGFLVFAMTQSGAKLLLPLTAVQILWMNLITDSLPALALAVDKNPGVMTMKPRPANAPLLDANSMKFILSAGILGGGLALGLLLGLPVMGFDASLTQTAVFCFIVLVQLCFALPARKVHLSPVINHWVLGALLIALLAQIAAMTIPALRLLLGVHQVDSDLMLILFLSITPCWFVVDRYSRYLADKNNHQSKG